MKSILKKYGTTIISIVASGVIGFIWWLNGAELQDAWLYAFAIFLILIPALETYFKNNKQ